VNSSAQASTANIFSTTGLSAGDTVKVVMGVGGSCAGGPVQDTLLARILPLVTPSLALKPVSDTVCANETVTFEVGSVSGQGTATSYDWYVNNAKTGTGPDLAVPVASGTGVFAVLTSDASCASPATAHSDTLTVNVRGSVTPLVEIGSDRTALCSNDRSAVFFVTRINGTGTAPGYQWYRGTQPIAGATGDTLRMSSLSDGDQISLQLTSSSPCRTTDGATSNAIAMSVLPSTASTITVRQLGTGGPGCEGDSVYLSATASQGTVLWSNGLTGNAVAATGWKTGDTVSAVLASTLVCASPSVAHSNTLVLSGTVRVSPPAISLSVGPDESDPLCPGPAGLWAVTGTGGLSYGWDVAGAPGTDSVYSGTVGASGLSGTLTATARGCFSGSVESVQVSKTFVYGAWSPVSVSLGPVSGCSGDSTLVSAQSSGDVSGYDWLVNGGVVAGTSGPSARLLLRDGDLVEVVAKPSGNCGGGGSTLRASATASVSTRPAQGFTYGTGPVLFCGGRDTVLTALESASGYTYSWLLDGQPFGSGRTSPPIGSAGEYSLVVANGSCSDTSVAEVSDAGPRVDLVPAQADFSPGDGVRLSAAVSGNAGAVTYAWSPASLTSSTDPQVTVYPTETVRVSVVVRSARGCTATDSALLRKVDRLFVPSAITPGTGDVNAYWNITGAEAYPDLDVRVYNRWGSLVHEQRGYATPWDGTLNGKDLPTGTYYYVIKHKKLDGPRVGDLTLVR
jgi:gliding motility-associated-like protein